MSNLLKNKKGVALNEAASVVVVLMIIAIVLGLGQSILENFMSTQCTSAGGTYWANQSRCGLGATATPVNSSAAFNNTFQGVTGLQTVSDFQTTIAIVVVAGLILGIIGAVLYQREGF